MIFERVWFDGAEGITLSRHLYVILALVILGTSCKRSRAPEHVVVHVLRDPSASFVAELRQADLEFSNTRHYVENGKFVIVGTLEGGSYLQLLQRFPQSPWDLVIFDSESKIPNDIRQQLGTETEVCGHHPAFIPSAINGAQREAAQMYLQFVAVNCK
jgi:hypothetical protein